ncbi:hypothetical protein TI39_contig285g00039 [Zymoseptoria brevis]|uniref:Uncharacterized protein n=1 Tax=Zymoseptoria brevis TaxID=1047168 RepID=A0A0F4GW39_9PEZI|nr:hypothetical protein TI39_contig285g00039 [Zymoseptoria brevis]
MAASWAAAYKVQALPTWVSLVVFSSIHTFLELVPATQIYTRPMRGDKVNSQVVQGKKHTIDKMASTKPQPSSKSLKQPKIDRAMSSLSQGPHQAGGIRMDASKSTTKPTTKSKGKSKLDYQQLYKESQKDNADLRRRFNEEKDHSADVEKENAELRATNAETAGLTMKRHRERIEDLERELKIEKLQTLGYGLLVKHIERDVRKWAEDNCLSERDLPNFTLWEEVPDTGFKIPGSKMNSSSTMIDGLGAAAKRKRGDAKDYALMSAKRRDNEQWQKSQQRMDMDDEDDETAQNEEATLARVKRETKVLLSR